MAGVWGQSLQQGPGAETLVRDSGAKPGKSGVDMSNPVHPVATPLHIRCQYGWAKKVGHYV